jgi:ankyrin repeat protein
MANSVSAAFRINDLAAHEVFARISLVYLLSLKDPIIDPSDILQQFPFICYSAQFWSKHFHAVGECLILDGLARRIFESPAMGYWLRTYDPDKHFLRKFDLEMGYSGFGSPNETYPSPLYYSSLLGLGRVTKQLVKEGADVNAPGGFRGSALHAACNEGHDVIVQMLLESGADVNMQGGTGSPLHAALERGNHKIVTVLLDWGADISARGFYGTVLEAACRGCDVKTVRFLLDRERLDINAGGPQGGALQAGSHSEAITRLLLDRGADVKSTGGRYGGALQGASVHGAEAVVQLLLSRGSDVHAQGPLGTALHVAAFAGHDSVVKLLLQNGADIQGRGGKHGDDALQIASRWGRESVVWTLLDRGADLTARGGEYGGALQAASYGGHASVVRLLIDRGADDNAQYSDALQAALKGYEDWKLTVSLEVKVGRVQSVGHGDWAWGSGHKLVMQLLRERGAVELRNPHAEAEDDARVFQVLKDPEKKFIELMPHRTGLPHIHQQLRNGETILNSIGTSDVKYESPELSSQQD